MCGPICSFGPIQVYPTRVVDHMTNPTTTRGEIRKITKLTLGRLKEMPRHNGAVKFLSSVPSKSQSPSLVGVPLKQIIIIVTGVNESDENRIKEGLLPNSVYSCFHRRPRNNGDGLLPGVCEDTRKREPASAKPAFQRTITTCIFANNPIDPSG